MTTRLDDRHRFYLRHAAQIHEWAALEDEVRTVLCTFLEQLVERLDVEGGPWDGDLRTRQADGTWPALDLYRQNWPHGDGEPVPTIRLEWNTRRVGLDDNTQAPYVGIRCQEGTPSRERIDRLLDSVEAKYLKHRSQWWPAWRYVPADISDEFTLQEYGSILTTALAEAFEDLAPVVDRAVADL